MEHWISYEHRCGITVANNNDDPWIIHGSDSGCMAWEITSQTEHDEVWSTDSNSNQNSVYSIEGGGAYGVAVGDIDDDGILKCLLEAPQVECMHMMELHTILNG